MKYRSTVRLLLEGIEGVSLLGFALLTWPVSRRWLKPWGTRLDDRERAWPGDTIANPPRVTSTRAITISARPAAVWPWILQIGLGRAGFYSYELIERLGGIPVRNVESIEPDWQSLAVEDEVILHPKTPGLIVHELVSERRICFRTQPASDGDPVNSWSFYLEPIGDASCRFLVRLCKTDPGRRSLLKGLAAGAEDALDFVMEQRMLRTLRRLAEASQGSNNVTP